MVAIEFNESICKGFVISTIISESSLPHAETSVPKLNSPITRDLVADGESGKKHKWLGEDSGASVTAKWEESEHTFYYQSYLVQ